jgi:hypothetical protein
MAFTDQQKAREKVRENYGQSGFAEEYANYKRVGYKRGDRVISAIGQSWDDAINELGKKDRK